MSILWGEEHQALRRARHDTAAKTMDAPAFPAGRFAPSAPVSGNVGKGIRAGAVFWSGHPAADMDALPFVRHAFRKIPRRLL